MREDVVHYLSNALQPIVAALQERTIGVGEWVEAVKFASYRAAHQSTDADSGRAVFSRMSIRTGLSRSELTQVRKRMGQGSGGRRSINRHRLARVIDGWLSNPAYLEADGIPRPLSADGPEPNLHSLSRACAGDVPSVSVIAELARHGLIRDIGAGYTLPLISYRTHALRGAEHFERFMRTELASLVSALRVEIAPRDTAAEASAAAEG